MAKKVMYSEEGITLFDTDLETEAVVLEIDPDTGNSTFKNDLTVDGSLGASGYSGESGYSGYSGISGYSGVDGESGFSGDSGFSGYSGYSGYSGDEIFDYEATGDVTTFAADANNRLIEANNTSDPCTVNLPTAVGNTGLMLIIKRTGTQNVIVDGATTETIDGQETNTLTTQYDTLRIMSNGANWLIV